jgi:hypothetical protein
MPVSRRSGRVRVNGESMRKTGSSEREEKHARNNSGENSVKGEDVGSKALSEFDSRRANRESLRASLHSYVAFRTSTTGKWCQ